MYTEDACWTRKSNFFILLFVTLFLCCSCAQRKQVVKVHLPSYCLNWKGCKFIYYCEKMFHASCLLHVHMSFFLQNAAGQCWHPPEKEYTWTWTRSTSSRLPGQHVFIFKIRGITHRERAVFCILYTVHRFRGSIE